MQSYRERRTKSDYKNRGKSYSKDDNTGRVHKDTYRSRRSDRGNEDRNKSKSKSTSNSKPEQKQKPKRIPVDLKPSGILTKYLHLSDKSSISANDVKSKYTPPKDEIIPTPNNCRYHLFKYNEKTDEQIEIPLLNYKSFFIFGRNKEISDIVIDDDEDGDLVSKQHAVLQFRDLKNDGMARLYLLDMGSTNGSFLNDDKVELPTRRFIELKNNDVFKLGDYDSILEFMVIEDGE